MSFGLKYQIPVSGVQTSGRDMIAEKAFCLKYQIPVSGVQTVPGSSIKDLHNRPEIPDSSKWSSNFSKPSKAKTSPLT